MSAAALLTSLELLEGLHGLLQSIQLNFGTLLLAECRILDILWHLKNGSKSIRKCFASNHRQRPVFAAKIRYGFRAHPEERNVVDKRQTRDVNTKFVRHPGFPYDSTT
jgi:hypothetical protein